MDCDLSDEELAKLIAQDHHYFKYIVHRYENKLFFYIKRFISISNEEAQDFLQEIFLKVFKYINSFDPSLKFSNWIYRIAHNYMISIIRKNKNLFNYENIDEWKIFKELIDKKDAEKELQKNFLKEELKKIVQDLPVKYKEVIILKYEEEKDYKEISDILKKPEGTIANLLNRGKKEILNKIKKSKIREDMKDFYYQ